MSIFRAYFVTSVHCFAVQPAVSYINRLSDNICNIRRLFRSDGSEGVLHLPFSLRMAPSACPHQGPKTATKLDVGGDRNLIPVRDIVPRLLKARDRLAIIFRIGELPLPVQRNPVLHGIAGRSLRILIVKMVRMRGEAVLLKNLRIPDNSIIKGQHHPVLQYWILGRDDRQHFAVITIPFPFVLCLLLEISL